MMTNLKLIAKLVGGCGYVLIPFSHPFLVKRLLYENSYFYPQVNNFSEEITYAENEGDFLKIGFDTAHSYNNSTHDKDFVQTKANELKDCIDSYTLLDAKKEVETYFNELKETFKDFI